MCENFCNFRALARWPTAKGGHNHKLHQLITNELLTPLKETPLLKAWHGYCKVVLQVIATLIEGCPKMRTKLLPAALLGILLLSTVSAHATTISRRTSDYGAQSAILVDTAKLATPFTLPGSSDFQEVLVCTNSDPGFVVDTDSGVGACAASGSGLDYDLLLSITSDANDGIPFTINLPDFEASTSGAFSDSYSFGIATCDVATSPPSNSFGNQPITANATTFCTSPDINISATCTTELQSLAAGGAFQIPGDCVTNGVTFYFDETGPGAAAPDFQGVSAPEPGSSSLVLFGLALLGSLWRKRRYAQL
jgi:PEP-CTERM motif